MILFEDVLAGYRALIVQYGRVPGQMSEPASAAIKGGLPSFFRDTIASATPPRDPKDYRCYGGHGEAMRSFAAVPWVACCRRELGTSVQGAYFIVLLFDQQMRGCWLSLNQGFTQYVNAFAVAAVASRACRQGAVTLARMIEPPPGFTSGPIDLAATTELGKGYEVGAIYSRFYPAGLPLPSADFQTDFLKLLDAYDDLANRVGKNTIRLLPDEEGAYQEAIAKVSRASNLPPLPAGPQPVPSVRASSSSNGWRRMPLPAAHALRNANFCCEVDPNHTTFVARSTGQNFVEAHHLIPMNQQNAFMVSLDVADNIIALCPNCHRQVHHGRTKNRAEIAARLFKKREVGLKRMGISVELTRIREIYRHPLDDD